MKVTMNEDLFELYSTGKNKKYKVISRNPDLMNGFVRAVEYMKVIDKAEQLANVSLLHYEKLKYQLSGLSSVRLSNRYVHRLLFRENEEGFEIELIEIDKTHYGNKK